MKKSLNRYAIYAICSVLFLITMYGILSRPELKIRIIYRLGQHTAACDYMVLYNSEELVKEQISGEISRKKTADRRMFDMFFTIPVYENEPEKIEFKLQPRCEDEDERIQIRTMEIWNHNISMYKYSPDQLSELFTVYDAKNAYVEGERYCIEPIDSKKYVTLEATKNWIDDYKASASVPNTLFYNLLVSALLLWLILVLIDRAWHTRNEITKKIAVDKTADDYRFQIIIRVLMVCALICVCIMAFFSKHYAHPDEDVSRLAIDYYMTHWLPPDMRDASVLGTFSNYGVSRLEEHTLYYLVAGKIGWISGTLFHINKYYRVLNVILFAIMVVMIFMKKHHNLWVLIAIGITPQLWYLYSYATSDAWDFFWSFLIIYQLIEKDSGLHKFLKNGSVHPISNIIWISFLFSMIFRGKQNYYLVLLFAFFVLLFKWCREREHRLQLLVRYGMIVITSVAMLIPRMGIEKYSQYRYETKLRQSVTAEADFQKIEKKKQEQKANEPVTMVTTRQSEGYSFFDVAIKDCKGILDGTTNSGVGSYGWLEYYMPYWYSYGIVGIYGILALLITLHLIRENRITGCFDALLMYGMITIAFLMMVYLCWQGEFQTQGRYVLSLALFVGYTAMSSEKVACDKKVQMIILFLMICSLMSYTLKGICNLV